MRFKTTNSQLVGIVVLLDMALTEFRAETVQGEIIEELVNRVFIKLQNKAMQLYASPSGYNFTLSDLEAKAFWVFFQRMKLPSEDFDFEVTQIQSMFNQIDNKYARTKTGNYANRGLAQGASTRGLDSPTRQN